MSSGQSGSRTAAGEPWTIGRVLAWAGTDLRDHGSSSPRLDAELLLGEVLGCDRVRLIVDAERPLAAAELARYRELHKRRRRGEPVAYLRGRREFYGRTFRVDARVLVPRPETEGLVEVALARTSATSLSTRALDLCTGSGCVAITLAKERPTSTVVASDISADALAVAADNALRLGARVGLRQSDLYAALSDWAGQLDLITANPPYVSDDELAALPVDVREFEPLVALRGGPDGLALVARIAAGAAQMLAPRGLLALEIGAGQAGAAAKLLADAGLVEVETAKDYAGIDRVIAARRPTTQ